MLPLFSPSFLHLLKKKKENRRNGTAAEERFFSIPVQHLPPAFIPY
jgi:hypothetical protein